MLERIAQVIASSGKIAVLPHVAADGDALGSSVALALVLQQMGKKAEVLVEEEVPYAYAALPGIGSVKVYRPFPGQYDLVVAVDCGDAERLGLRRDVFDQAKMTINIDHHPTNTQYAVHNFIDPSAAATAEIIYRLVKLLGQTLDKSAATCLYVGLATDTGGFRFSNTTPFTHKAAADLIEAGVDVAAVSQRVFDSTSFQKVKLLAAAIDALELFENGKAAVMTITNEALRKTGAKDEDADGIINVARNIRGVEVAAMLRQLDNGDIKVNLRSNTSLDVSKIAVLYRGGGHKKAAGYTISGQLELAKLDLIKDIKEAL